MLFHGSGEGGEGDLYQQFIAIHQEGTIWDYVINFDLPKKVLKATFINGLKDETRSIVRILQSVNLTRAMTLVVMIDEKQLNVGKSKIVNGVTRASSYGYNRTTNNQPLTNTNS